jgi:hypothetical protein
MENADAPDEFSARFRKERAFGSGVFIAPTVIVSVP